MKHQTVPREALPRAIEGSSALLSPARGRASAPRVSPWFPILSKVAAAVVAAGVLAAVGLASGRTSPASAGAPSPGDGMPPTMAGAPPAPAPMIAASPSAPSPSAPAEVPEGAAPIAEARGDPSAGVTADGRVILNVASEDELTKLPGIGPSRARAIVALRQRLIKFRAVEDLLRVKGIGRKTLRRIKPSVILDRPATPDT